MKLNSKLLLGLCAYALGWLSFDVNINKFNWVNTSEFDLTNCVIDLTVHEFESAQDQFDVANQDFNPTISKLDVTNDEFDLTKFKFEVTISKFDLEMV